MAKHLELALKLALALVGKPEKKVAVKRVKRKPSVMGELAGEMRELRKALVEQGNKPAKTYHAGGG